MAINRETREDLMRDATAYVRRLMIPKLENREAIFIGIRQNGGWSAYFGEDPVYQFDAQCKLRRVHLEAKNYAASDGKLVFLHRDRSGGHVEIQRIYVTEAERRLLADCHLRLEELAELLQSSSFEVANRHPLDDQALVVDLLGLIRLAISDIQVSKTANA